MVDGWLSIYNIEHNMVYLLAKYVQGEPLDLRRVDKRQGAYITELRNAGFLDFVPSEQPKGELGISVVESLDVVDGKLVQSWRVTKDAPRENTM